MSYVAHSRTYISHPSVCAGGGGVSGSADGSWADDGEAGDAGVRTVGITRAAGGFGGAGGGGGGGGGGGDGGGGRAAAPAALSHAAAAASTDAAAAPSTASAPSTSTATPTAGGALSQWHSLKLVELQGGTFVLKDFRGVPLASVLPRSTPASARPTDRSWSERALTTWVTSCAQDLGRIAFFGDKRSNKSESHAQGAVRYLANEITPLLSRLVALSLKRGGRENDPVAFLAVRNAKANVAWTFEPADSFGSYLAHSAVKGRSHETVLSLCSPTCGYNSALDNAFELVRPVNRDQVYSETDKLTKALESLDPGGDLFLLLILPPSSTLIFLICFLLSPDYDYACVLKPQFAASKYTDFKDGSPLYYRRGAYFSDFNLKIGQVTSANTLLECLVGHRKIGPQASREFLAALPPAALDEVCCALRAQRHTLRSDKRVDWIKNLNAQKWAAVGAALHAALFDQPLLRAPASPGVANAGAKRRRGAEQPSAVVTSDGLCSSQPAALSEQDSADGAFGGQDGDERLTEALFLFDDVALPALDDKAARLYYAFHSAAATTIKCMLRHETTDSHGNLVVTLKLALPGLRDDLELARGMPVILTLQSANDRAAAMIDCHISCSCQQHRTGLVAGAGCVVLGCEGGRCWHERYLRECDIGAVMGQRRPLTGPVPEYTDPTVVPLGCYKAQYAYVFVSVPDSSALGLGAEAVVTVHSGYMRCTRCQSGRRHDTQVPTKGKLCPHIKALQAELDEHGDLDADLLEVRDVFLGSPRKSKSPATPLFRGDTLVFPSRSSFVARQWQGRGYVPPPIERLTTSGPGKYPTGLMGGECDPEQIRLSVLLDWLKERIKSRASGTDLDPQAVLAQNGLATPHDTCLDRSCREALSEPGDFSGECAQCGAEQPSLRACTLCARAYCVDCCLKINYFRAEVDATFMDFKPEHDASIPDKSAAEKRGFSRELDSAVKTYWEHRARLLDLRPTAPTEGRHSFLKGNTSLAGVTTIFYPTHSAKGVQVWNLICDEGCCELEATGAEQRVHRQTKDTAVHLDVLNMFHFSALKTRFHGINGFADLMSRIYQLNCSGPFMHADRFARCYYGAMTRQLDGQPFNRPCFTCPMRQVDGIWVNGCTVIGTDAKMSIKVSRRMLSQRTAKAPNVAREDAGAPVAFRKRSQLSRLFFPGGKRTEVGRARGWLFAVAKCALGLKLSKKEASELDKSEAAARHSICNNAAFEPYRDCINIVIARYEDAVADSEELPVSEELQRILCRWVMAITNKQCEVNLTYFLCAERFKQ